MSERRSLSVDFLIWPASDVAISYYRTALRLLHFGGLVLGAGGAVYVDLLIQRYSRKGMTDEAFGLLAATSRCVAVGLALLWITGIGFLVLYGFVEPAKLSNPKIYAKMTIVAMLSANGIIVHRLVMPFLRQRIGRPLMAGVHSRVRIALIACASVSIVSWSMPAVLGAAPQLNFVAPYWSIMAVYALLLLLGFAVIALVMTEAGALKNKSDENIRMPFAPALREGAAD